ncbi:diguanylate cyclase domain-containing protein [Krasilnikovia sp. MM14-A1259]|uniref:diguanylate cyclase domain-containing protein n=1 Tax=Krasilnikovia sp. MM14-A1259 TaxID=3373539 RepID=UPI0038024D56
MLDGVSVRGDTDGHLQALRALNAVSKRVHSSLDLTETLDAVAEGVVEAAGFGLAVVNLTEPNGDFTVVSAAGSDELRRSMVGTRGSAEHWLELFRRAERWGALYFVDHRKGIPEDLCTWIPDIPEPDDPDGWHPQDCLFAPLTAPSGEWVGVLSVDLPDGGVRPGPQQIEVLSLFAEHAAIAILHARMHSSLERSKARLQYAATHDALTGLPNRACLRARVDALLRQPPTRIGVMVVDLDGFKWVNDAAGHEAGDEVLQVVARRMQRHLREGDLLARMGGDEFVAVLVGVDVDEAVHETAARFRAVVAQPVVGRTGTHRVTASVGCAIGTVTDGFAQLLAVADAEMYRAKRRRLAPEPAPR